MSIMHSAGRAARGMGKNAGLEQYQNTRVTLSEVAKSLYYTTHTKVV